MNLELTQLNLKMGGSASVPIEFIDTQKVPDMCDDASEGECPICYETIKLKQTRNCCHFLCGKCMAKVENKCPLCRGRIVDGMTVTEFHEQLHESLEAAGLL